jgi:ribosome recycling factor
MTVQDVQTHARERMTKTEDALKRELASIRTGRANPSLVDHVRVDYYGSPTPINQLATISAPEARLLTIQPWDRKALAPIEKAIQKSDLGLTPQNDGAVIRLVIPQLSDQRRKELTKLVQRRLEEARVAVRNIRRDGQEELKKLEKSKEISEDEHRRAAEQLQKQTDQMIAELDRLGQQKEAELLEV